MKKMMLVMIAAVMAIGFSAFTAATKSNPTNYYHNGSSWQTTSSSCPSGTVKQCEVEIDGVDRLIYTAPNFSSPLMRN